MLRRILDSYAAAVPVVHQTIDIYNRIRPRYSISKLTPEQAHGTTEPLIRIWKSKKYSHLNPVLLQKPVKPEQY